MKIAFFSDLSYEKTIPEHKGQILFFCNENEKFPADKISIPLLSSAFLSGIKNEDIDLICTVCEDKISSLAILLAGYFDLPLLGISSHMLSSSVYSLLIPDTVDSFAHLSEIGQQVVSDHQKGQEILKIKYSEGSIILKLPEEDLLVSLEDYQTMGLDKCESLSHIFYQDLKSKETFYKAYRTCVKKASSHIFGEKKMLDYLKDNFELSSKENREILRRLKELRLVDDEAYAEKIYRTMRRSCSSKKDIARRLKEEGISPSVISGCISSIGDDDLPFAIKKAMRYQKGTGGKSLSYQKKTIYNKLIKDGFDDLDAQKALSSLDFSFAQSRQGDILKNELEKVLRRYQRKYSGNDLYIRILRNLTAKGFSKEDISVAYHEMEGV